MADESFQEKTERATPKKIKDARERGQVARSQDLGAVVVLLSGLSAIMALGPSLAGNIRDLASWIFSHAASFELGSETAPALLIQVSWIFFKTVAPIIGIVAAAALAIAYLQVGALFAPKAIEPKFDKLDVIKGLKNLLSLKSLFNLIRDTLKLFIIGIVAYYSIKAEIPNFIIFPDLSIAQIATSMTSIVLKVAMKIAAVLVFIAAADYAYQRYEYFKKLRMTKQEIKEEFKHTEGNPQIRARVRAIQREQSRKRMMQEVPEADVVVTNPTHIAVALKYDTDEMAAPTVIAKGQRLIADAIRKIADEAGVPIVENKPLARALFKTVEVGMQVPADLYKAVAEVLAYVYGLKDKSKGGAS